MSTYKNENNSTDKTVNLNCKSVSSFEQIGQHIDLDKSSETLKRLVEIVQNIPKDVKDTRLFIRIQELKGKDIQYEDIQWVKQYYGYKNIIDNRKWLTSFE